MAFCKESLSKLAKQNLLVIIKNVISLNFVKKALHGWTHFNSIEPDSITRVGRGYSLRCLFPDHLQLPGPFKLEDVEYNCKRPAKPEKYLGEILPETP